MTEISSRRGPAAGQQIAFYYLCLWIIYLAHMNDSAIRDFKVGIIAMLILVGLVTFGFLGQRMYGAAARRDGGVKKPPLTLGAWIKSDMAKKIAGMWLVSLISCLFPYWVPSRWYPLIHSTAFIIAAPLIMALLAPFLLPQSW